QRVPPDYRFPYGHTHKEQEELYVVVRGSGRMKLDDEVVSVKEYDVIRVPPGTWRGYEAGPDGLELLVIGAPSLGATPREDVEGKGGGWANYPAGASRNAARAHPRDVTAACRTAPERDARGPCSFEPGGCVMSGTPAWGCVTARRPLAQRAPRRRAAAQRVR